MSVSAANNMWRNAGFSVIYNWKDTAIYSPKSIKFRCKEFLRKILILQPINNYAFFVWWRHNGIIWQIQWFEISKSDTYRIDSFAEHTAIALCKINNLKYKYSYFFLLSHTLKRFMSYISLIIKVFLLQSFKKIILSYYHFIKFYSNLQKWQSGRNFEMKQLQSINVEIFHVP